jgi:hypothetical protein
MNEAVPRSKAAIPIAARTLIVYHKGQGFSSWWLFVRANPFS